MRDVMDDMDDLFRRAAENYPLNTSNSDWDKVQRAIQSDAPVEKVSKKNNYRKFLLLLFLVPALLFVTLIFTAKNHTDKLTQSPGLKENSKSIEEKNTVHSNTRTKATSNKNEASQLPPGRPITPTTGNTALKEKNGVALNVSKRARMVRHNYLVTGKTKMTSIDGNTETVTGDVNETIKPGSLSIDNSKTNNPAAPTVDTNKLNNGQTNRQDNTSVAINDSLQPKNPSLAHKQNSLKKTRELHFYGGVIAGPDVSTVKLQKVMRSGFTGGVLAGYKISKKLSVESGLYFTKKYYYSEGLYFSTKKIQLPTWLKIDNVDGYCNMIELPVNIKYDFISKRKETWFAVAGTSSYFMKKESYGYRYDSYGQEMEKHISFKESSQIWASVLNLSLGYSRKIGKTTIFRIEPYIKVPFKGVGIGSLPITSSGVYLGFIKKLF